MEIDYVSLGNRIRYYRTQRGMSQEELAEYVDVGPAHISNIERGEKSASLRVVLAVAKALRVTVDSLLSESLTEVTGDQDGAEFGILFDCSKEENDILIKTMSALKSILRDYSIRE